MSRGFYVCLRGVKIQKIFFDDICFQRKELPDDESEVFWEEYDELGPAGEGINSRTLTGVVFCLSLKTSCSKPDDN
jgi:hypothetical protein